MFDSSYADVNELFGKFDQNRANIFKDQNGDGKIDNSDRVIIEGALPTFYYGFNSDMRYKNFSFSFSIIGQTGGYLLNNTGLNALNILLGL